MTHMGTIGTSSVVLSLFPPTLFCTAIAIFVVCYNEAVDRGHLPHWAPLLHVESLPFTLTAPVLALLLVFRTNASFTRFDEARKAWGSNVNRTRDFARMALAWVRSASDADMLHCLLRHVKAYPFCLKDHLTAHADGDDGDDGLRGELAGILEKHEVESLLSSQHRPNYVLQVLSEAVGMVQMTYFEKMAMDDNLTRFHDNVGTCERIFNTPIPLQYTRLTSRVLLLWHLALPFGLWNACGWLTIPATFMSVAALFYIEEVGVQIEEPFCILALAAISKGIKDALDGLCAAHKQVSIVCSNCQQLDNAVQNPGFRNVCTSSPV